MKSTLEMKHLVEAEANKDADENAMKEQFVSAAMAQLKELAGTSFNIIIVRDYEGDTKGFDEADPPMPLIKVEYSPGQTADYRIYLFTKGDYQRPEGPRWEESDIQWWPHDRTTVYKPGGVIVDEIMKLTFSERPGMMRVEREAKQNSLTLDKAVRDANTRITDEQAEEIRNSDNPEQTKKDIEEKNTAAMTANITADSESDAATTGDADVEIGEHGTEPEDTEPEDTEPQLDADADTRNDQDEPERNNEDANDQNSDATLGQNRPDANDDDPPQTENQDTSADDQTPSSSNDTAEQDNNDTAADETTPSPDDNVENEDRVQDQGSAPPSLAAEETPEAPDPVDPEPQEPDSEDIEPEEPAPEEPESGVPESQNAGQPEEDEAGANQDGEDEDEKTVHQ